MLVQTLVSGLQVQARLVELSDLNFLLWVVFLKPRLALLPQVSKVDSEGSRYLLEFLY